MVTSHLIQQRYRMYRRKKTARKVFPFSSDSKHVSTYINLITPPRRISSCKSKTKKKALLTLSVTVICDKKNILTQHNNLFRVYKRSSNYPHTISLVVPLLATLPDYHAAFLSSNENTSSEWAKAAKWETRANSTELTKTKSEVFRSFLLRFSLPFFRLFAATFTSRYSK